MIDDSEYLQEAVWNHAVHNSLDLILDPLLEEERKNFRFPKDFSFKDEEFRLKMDRLYGKKQFEIHYMAKLKELIPLLFKSKTSEELEDNIYNVLTIGYKERAIKRIVRANYREKCKEYFIEYHHWPKPVAKLTAKIVGLPRCREHKTKIGYVFSTFPAAFAGNLSKRYAEPIAKLMNVERKFLTASSIGYDVINFALSGYLAYKLWTGEPHREDIIEQMYNALNLGKDVFKYMVTANAATRLLEIPVRTFYYIKDKTHTYSPASLFPLNPNFIDGIPFTYLYIHNSIKNLKEQADKYNINLNGFKKAQSQIMDKLRSNGTKII
jgi:hypothetical protein